MCAAHKAVLSNLEVDTLEYFFPCDFNQKFHFQSGLADVPLEDRIGCCVDSLSLDSSGFLQRQLHTCLVAPLLVECCWSLMPNAAGGMPFKKLYLREDAAPLQKNKNVRKKSSEVHRNVKYLPLCASGWPWCEFYSISAQSLFSLTMES